MQKVFVFGSNLAGRHGAGSAKEALLKHGAIRGKGVGMAGNSYAIPTKDAHLNVLPLNEIKAYVQEFKQFARHNRHIQFAIVAIGCGLAGYKPEDIAPMFYDAPGNCKLPEEFMRVLEKQTAENLAEIAYETADRDEHGSLD